MPTARARQGIDSRSPFAARGKVTSPPCHQPAAPPLHPRPLSPAGRGGEEGLAPRAGDFRSAQLKAAVSVNRELIELYRDIGKQIVKRQQAESWGQSVVGRLARDLQREFPGVASFSSQNLWKMRAFFLAYTEEVRNLSQPVRGFDGQTLPEPIQVKALIS